MQCAKSTIIHVLNEKRILEEFCDDGLEGTFYYFLNPKSSASYTRVKTSASQVTDLEIIFSGVQLLGGFENFVQLKSLRLMNTGLVRISRL